jgi:hypothetical protein
MKLLLAILVVASGLPQQRDTPAVVPTPMGTSTVSGTVVLPGEPAVPVRRAVVTLSSVDGVDHRSVLTDDAGQFRFASLPAGRYSLESRKAAHLTTSYGARRPGRPGTSVIVAEGQTLAGLTISMARGGVLSGRLTLENGEPLPNTLVRAIPTALATAGGTAFISEAEEFRTDDDGDFRIYGLAPDAYLLLAFPEIGRGEVERRSREAFDATVASIQKPGGPFPIPGATIVGYAPTYFPGTPVAADATPIVVAAGDVKTGLSMTVSMTRAATVSGVVLNTNGQPTEAAQVSIDQVGPPMPISQMFSIRLNRLDAQGRFSFLNVAPGVYRVSARGGGVTLGPQGPVSRTEDQTDWALAEIEVRGDDVTGLTLSLRTGLTFSGKVTAVGPVPAPAAWKGAGVMLRQVRPVGQPTGRGLSTTPGRAAAVGPDGTFRVVGLMPADYEVVLTLPAAMGAEWAVSAMLHNSLDVRDTRLTFADGSITDVNIVMTTQRTELSGRLTSESGVPATGYYVVIFPSERALWHAASPRIRVMRPAVDGVFSTRDLPPGTYRLAALTDVEDDEHRRAEFLESIYEAAISVTVAAGTVTKQDVRIR